MAINEKNGWIEEIKSRYTSLKDIEKLIELNPDEAAFFNEIEINPEHEHIPLSITHYVLSLFNDRSAINPIRLQFMPTVHEFEENKFENDDPLYEEQYRVLPRLIHRYESRVLLLVTDACAVNCRFCFRRYYKERGRKRTEERGIIDSGEIESVCDYLEAHNEVRELILSGGDPLIVSDGKLEDILRLLRAARKDLVLRLASRVLSVLPQRINGELVNILSRYMPLWFISHFNHPLEITAQSRKAVSMLVDSGIPVVNQTVLLKGINDNINTLAELFKLLVKNRIKPYYLFQGDLARGTAHFRVDLKRGISIARTLKKKLSGLEMPDYALDLPGGGGKVSLLTVRIEDSEKGYLIENVDGKVFIYPK